MRDPNTILDFGIHIGKSLSDSSIPDNYIQMLADRKVYMNPKNRFEVAWKVPVSIWMAARLEMERRGYRHIGERWEKEE